MSAAAGGARTAEPLVDLRDKACLVTGAASGIGRATVERFAALGALVVAADLDAEGLRHLREDLARDGLAISCVAGDVSGEADVRRMVGAAVDTFGRLDVAVANAGVIPLGDVLETTAEEWDRVHRIDGRGMFLTCKHAIDAMRGRGGSVVCLSSISGLAGQARQAAYGPAKFIATGLAMHLAVEWAPHGIRVNAVAPGTIRTERVAELDDEPGGPEYLEKMANAHPIGRLGAPEEVAAAIAFLASDAASFITGAVLPVDGGYLAQ